MDKIDKIALNEKLASHFNLPFRWYADNLNDCFKWLVPKLREVLGNEYFEIVLKQAFRLEQDRWVFTFEGMKTPWSHASNDNPALALCLAISKLIDSESKDATR